MRSRAPVFTLKNGLIVLSLGLLGIWGWMGLASCHSDRVGVNPKDPQSPQYAYRQDELALLSLMADDVQELERKKQYATIYDDYTSQDFKSSISRRRFLIITNCVETYLGGMDSDGYDPHDLGFRRETVKNAKGSNFLDVLNRKVHRIMGLVDEQMVFVPDGLNFKLNGLYWISKDKEFLQCVAESPAKDQEGQPATEGEATAGNPTPATEQGATAETGKPSETGASTAPGTETNATGTETKPGETGTSGASVPSQTTGQKTPVTSPVQEMRPAEARKATSIHARPAGAGAVIDQRPSAPARAKQVPHTEEGSSQDHAPIPSGESSPDPDRHRVEPTHDSPANSKPIPSSIPPLNQNTAAPTPH